IPADIEQAAAQIEALLRGAPQANAEEQGFVLERDQNALKLIGMAQRESLVQPAQVFVGDRAASQGDGCEQLTLRLFQRGCDATDHFRLTQGYHNSLRELWLAQAIRGNLIFACNTT